MLKYDSIAALAAAAGQSGEKISALTLAQQSQEIGRPPEEIYEGMRQSLWIMRESAEQGVSRDLRSTSGLTGGDAYRLQQRVAAGESLCGPVFGGALVRALAVSGLNAAMGRIVAAPTAGSCGILPAAVLTVMEARGLSEREAVMALFTASAVGMVIAKNASIAGAEGGCQAECGSAAAMAAAALTEMCGGTPAMVGHAVAIALKNILGLVCDPVAGLVEIPCIKRNAAGVANALTAAELALAGIESAIPPDEVIMAMKRIGDQMPSALRETAEGGLADTPTGRALFEKVFGNNG